jgi:hypothetical protein
MTKNFCDQCEKEIIENLFIDPHFHTESTILLTIHKENKIFCDVVCLVNWLKKRGNVPY